MRKDKLKELVDERKDEINLAERGKHDLLYLFEKLNKGQKKQFAKDPKIKEIFDFWGIKYEE